MAVLPVPLCPSELVAGRSSPFARQEGAGAAIALSLLFWAVSIHSVTAFLYSGLGGRPFWTSALLVPRFIASAFITGPAFVILLLQVIRRATGLPIGEGPQRTLTFMGVWIEKGMGLIIPGFIPSTLHELALQAPADSGHAPRQQLRPVADLHRQRPGAERARHHRLGQRPHDVDRDEQHASQKKSATLSMPLKSITPGNGPSAARVRYGTGPCPPGRA